MYKNIHRHGSHPGNPRLPSRSPSATAPKETKPSQERRTNTTAAHEKRTALSKRETLFLYLRSRQMSTFTRSTDVL